jgi:hypothetical protein
MGRRDPRADPAQVMRTDRRPAAVRRQWQILSTAIVCGRDQAQGSRVRLVARDGRHEFGSFFLSLCPEWRSLSRKRLALFQVLISLCLKLEIYVQVFEIQS